MTLQSSSYGENLPTGSNSNSNKAKSALSMQITLSTSPEIRTDPSYKDPPSSSRSWLACDGFWDMNTLQDSFCGNVGALMESRDDDNVQYPNDANYGTEGKITKANSPNPSLVDSIIDSTHGIVGSLSKDFDLITSNSKATTQSRKKQHQDGTESLGRVKAMLDPTAVSSAKRNRFERYMTMIDSASRVYGSHSLPVADLYISMGIDLFESSTEKRSKKLALLLYEEAYVIYQAKSGDSDVRAVDCRVRLGRTLHALGRHDEGLDYLCQAVYMREALLGELHPSVSDIWVIISSIHQAKNKLELALKASAKALSGYRNANGDKHITVINVLITIAQLHTGMKNYDKAADIEKYVRAHSPASTDPSGVGLVEC